MAQEKKLPDNCNLLGLEFHREETAFPPKLPLYLTQRTAQRLTGTGADFILIQIGTEEKITALALRKNLEKYLQAFGCPVGFAFEGVTAPQRRALLREGIPFVAPGQVYLPFLGVALTQRFMAERKPAPEKMMPATQSLFLWLLYRAAASATKTEAAQALGLTKTSLTRATDQLRALGLLTQNRVGTALEIALTKTGRAAYEQARSALIDPVQKRLTVRAADLPPDLPMAGESALSKGSMLNPPTVPVFAVSKGAPWVRALEQTDSRWEEQPTAVLELWKYDPALFAREDMVDPISLACSLAACEDERVEDCLEEYLEDVKW